MVNESNRKVRAVSSLVKCLENNMPEDFEELKSASLLVGERFSFQLLIWDDSSTQNYNGAQRVRVSVSGVNGATVRAVRQVYADFPAFTVDTTVDTPYYLKSNNNLYPEILEELENGEYHCFSVKNTSALWIELTPDSASVDHVTVTLSQDGKVFSETTVALDVVPVPLPEQKLMFTQWFHCDCLASYYNVPIFSEEHWRIIENFARCAVRNGINCLLTPIFTPPLDTAVGHERPTVQLVKVKVDKKGKYSFDFALLDRWLDMCNRIGVKYYEISHLFTQWGAEYAPKVVADTPEGEKRIFGWDTPGTEGKYPEFLSVFLPALVSYLKGRGILDRCRFHVSDEPEEHHFERYKKATEIVAPYLKDCVCVDAMSGVEFYRKGAVKVPIPPIDKIDDFLAEDIPERWAYYCCGQWNKVSNRFIAYPSFRNRIIGIQLWKYGINGFLQWGYNFYYSMGSRRLINPYICQSADSQLQNGDSFSVYPSSNGEPVESLRIAVFYEAIQDLAALSLLEEKIGKDKVLEIVDGLAGMNVTFSDYPYDENYILKVREKVNQLIRENI